MRDDTSYSRSEYNRWGHLSRENLIPKDNTSSLPNEGAILSRTGPGPMVAKL